MAPSIKELVVVMLIAATVFWASQPIVALYVSLEDATRRKNVWIVLTLALFLCPNFWWFAVIAIPVLIAAGRKEKNVAALYLFILQAVPPIIVLVPMIGISFLFYADNNLLLSLCVLFPAILRSGISLEDRERRKLDRMDQALLAFCVLQSFFYLHFETSIGVVNQATLSDAVRRAFVLIVGNFVPYFAISRLTMTRQALLEAVASFCLICGLLAAFGIFESARHWLLYSGIAERWGSDVRISAYLMRGASLRAMASAGHPLALGFLLAIAFGFWLFLQSQIKSLWARIMGSLLLWLGLLSAYSRGPWLGAVAIFIIYSASRPGAFTRLAKACAAALVLVVVIGVTPLGSKIVDVLPFMGGTVDSSNVTYRRELFDYAWQIVKSNPWLGDQNAILKLQTLRQGQGIIDLVNAYVQILLGSGFVGLTIFLGFASASLINAYKYSRKARLFDSRLADLGAVIAACIAGTLIMISDTSFGIGMERMFYALAGMSSAYARVVRKSLGPAHCQLQTDIPKEQRESGL